MARDAQTPAREGSWRTIVDGLALTPEIWHGIWWTLVLAVVAASGRVVVAIGVQVSLDLALVPGSGPESIIPIVVACAGAVAAAGAASVWMNRRLARASENALAALRVKAFEHILRVPPSRFGDIPRSAHVSRVTSDIDTITQFTQSGGVSLLTNLFQALVATAVMFWYSWPLALLVLVLTAPVVLVMRWMQAVIAERYGHVRIAIGRLYGGLGEAIEGAEVIRGFGARERVQARLDTLIGDVRERQDATLWPIGFNTSIGELISGIVTTAVILTGAALGVGVFGTWLPEPSVGELVAFLFLITFFVRPLQFMVGQLGEAQNSVAGWRRVLEILRIPAGAVSGGDGERIPAGAVRVQVRGLGFEYVPGRAALDGVDADIRPGTHIAIVGETGSGKTTFAKLVTRQLDATRGDIRLNGVRIDRISEDAFVRRVAVVPQDAFLFDRTVAENIALVDEVFDEERVWQVLADLDLLNWATALPLGIATPVGQRGEALSAGGRQLVALARAAYLAPDLLVLDEATSGIDPDTDVRVQHALRRLTRGRTTITIAHRMATASTADRILVFDAGRLVEQGAHDDLLALGGRYAQLHGAWTEPAHPGGSWAQRSSSSTSSDASPT